jgi:hypothetical protein
VKVRRFVAAEQERLVIAALRRRVALERWAKAVAQIVGTCA